MMADDSLSRKERSPMTTGNTVHFVPCNCHGLSLPHVHLEGPMGRVNTPIISVVMGRYFMWALGAWMGILVNQDTELLEWELWSAVPEVRFSQEDDIGMLETHLRKKKWGNA